MTQRVLSPLAWQPLKRHPSTVIVVCTVCKARTANASSLLRGWQQSGTWRLAYRCGDCAKAQRDGCMSTAPRANRQAQGAPPYPDHHLAGQPPGGGVRRSVAEEQAARPPRSHCVRVRNTLTCQVQRQS
jgi:hypothetical protein